MKLLNEEGEWIEDGEKEDDEIIIDLGQKKNKYDFINNSTLFPYQ